MSAPIEPGAEQQDTHGRGDGCPSRMLFVGASAGECARALAFFTRSGSAVEIAGEAATAIERLAREPFDLILLDMQMPAMEGYETARRIRAQETQRARPRVPILALTGGAFRGECARCLGAGCDALVAFPLDERDLREAVQSCTELLRIESVPELADLLPNYLAHRRADADALWESFEGGDWARVGRLGHDMKGSGKIYGLPRISEIGARIETSGKAGDSREARLALATLESYLARALRSIESAPTPPAAP